MQQLLDMLMGQENQSNLSDIISQLGIDEDQAKQAIGSLLPGVSQGITEQVQAQNTSILDQIASGQQQQYLDDDNARLYDQGALDEGNAILGQIFQDQAATQQLAGQAAQESGVDAGIIEKLMPMVASMAMGGLGKQANAMGLSDNPNGIADMLSAVMGGQLNSASASGGFNLQSILGLVSKFLKK